MSWRAHFGDGQSQALLVWQSNLFVSRRMARIGNFSHLSRSASYNHSPPDGSRPQVGLLPHRRHPPNCQQRFRTTPFLPTSYLPYNNPARIAKRREAGNLPRIPPPVAPRPTLRTHTSGFFWTSGHQGGGRYSFQSSPECLSRWKNMIGAALKELKAEISCAADQVCGDGFRRMQSKISVDGQIANALTDSGTRARMAD